MTLQKFEEMVGYSVGEPPHRADPAQLRPQRDDPLPRHLPAVQFHDIPEKIPIIECTEAFVLPLYHGFRRWLERQNLFDQRIEETPTDRDRRQLLHSRSLPRISD
jgi:hypothetical protein